MGNMLFLWVFGNSVNSKMGNVAYLLFYLAAAERRLKSLDENFDRSKIELAELRSGAVWPSRR